MGCSSENRYCRLDPAIHSLWSVDAGVKDGAWLSARHYASANIFAICTAPPRM
jgi:hypothetical protein